jgi:DNA-binding HxlR family transcriptional regulator
VTRRRTYGQYCPIARSLDLLGERWTLLIVRDLLTGPQRFSDLLDHLPGMWANLLAPRLRDLEAAGIVERRELPPPAARTVYDLTARGRALAPVLYELARFGFMQLDDPPAGARRFAHLMPEAVRGLVLVEHLPATSLVADLDLDEGRYTLAVAPPGGPLVARVQVSDSAPDRADATLRGSWFALLAHRRGEPGAAARLSVDGRPRARAALRTMFGLPPA